MTLGCRENVNDDKIQFVFTDLLSASSEGELADFGSHGKASLSYDGRFAAFASSAANLSPGSTATTHLWHIYVRDTVLGTTEIVSRKSGVLGAVADETSESPTISSNGRWVAFVSEANLSESPTYNTVQKRIWLRDRELHMTYLISQAPTGDPNGDSESPSIAITSSGIIRIAFSSHASNLLPVGQNDTNQSKDIFYRECDASGNLSQSNVLVSRRSGANGEQTQNPSLSDFPVISGNGEYIAFESNSSYLEPDGDASDPLYSTNRIFRRQLKSPEETLPITLKSGVYNSSTNPPLNGTNIAMSGDGNLIAFESNDTLGESYDAGTDIYLRDVSLTIPVTILISQTSSGAQVNDDCTEPSLSEDGNRVTFESTFSAFLGTDQNNAQDIFLYTRNENILIRASVGTYGTEPNGTSQSATLSPDGRFVAFRSLATNLTSELDLNGVSDFFLRGPIP